MNFLIISIAYAMMWFVIYVLLGFSKSKYLVTALQRNNFITVLHCFFIPLLTCLYFFTLKEPFGYQYLLDNPIRHLISLSAGYYIFSGINIFRLPHKIDVANIVHHFIVAFFFLYVTIRPEYPIYYAWILFPQATGFFYHTYVILKDTVGVTKERLEAWYTVNFYSWIFFRFMVEGLFLLGAIYYEYTYLKLPIGLRIFTFVGFLVSYYFNIYWMVLLVKKRRQKKKEAYKLSGSKS